MRSAQNIEVSRWRWRTPLTILSIALFLLALTQPAFFWGQAASSTGPSGRVLLQGWRGLTAGYVEWLANPLLLLTWVLTLRRHRSPSLASLISATATVALMLVFLCRQTLRLPSGSADAAAILTYGVGYWLWLVSGLTGLIANWR